MMRLIVRQAICTDIHGIGRNDFSSVRITTGYVRAERITSRLKRSYESNIYELFLVDLLLGMPGMNSTCFYSLEIPKKFWLSPRCHRLFYVLI